MSRFVTLLNAVTVTGAGASVNIAGKGNVRTYQGVLVGTGTYTASVDLLASIDGVNFVKLTTLALSNTTPTVGYTSTDAWAYVQANVTAITGTGTAVTVTQAT